MKECEFCVEGNECMADDDKGYVCTRPKGHTGYHVACGGTCHTVSRWPNTEDDKLLKAHWQTVLLHTGLYDSMVRACRIVGKSGSDGITGDEHDEIYQLMRY